MEKVSNLKGWTDLLPTPKSKRKPHMPTFTSAELEVLRLLSEGRNNKEIAQMHPPRSVKTIDTHHANINRKVSAYLGLRPWDISTVKVVVWAIANEYVPMPTAEGISGNGSKNGSGGGR